MQTREKTKKPEYNANKQFRIIIDPYALRKVPQKRTDKKQRTKQKNKVIKTNLKKKTNPKKVSISKDNLIKEKKNNMEVDCDEIFDSEGNCICYFCSGKDDTLTKMFDENKNVFNDLPKKEFKESDTLIFEEMLHEQSLQVIPKCEDKETQTDSIVKAAFNIELYSDTIKDILNKKRKSETWDWVQEYTNNSDKLDRAFFKTKPTHIFFTKFEKLKHVVEHEFGITPEEVNVVRDPVSIFIYENELHKQVVQKSGYSSIKKLDSIEIFFIVVLEIALLYKNDSV